MKRSVSLEWLGYLLMFSSILGLDQLVKYLAYHHLRPILSVDLWPGVFRLHYCENTGAAFSILEGQIWFFVLLTVILSAVILYFIAKGRVRSVWARVAMICVLSGGVGNLIDRIFRGFVVDMFDFYLIDFAVFNVADIFVTCGSIFFVVLFLFSKGEVFD